jgi:hypothetical protein
MDWPNCYGLSWPHIQSDFESEQRGTEVQIQRTLSGRSYHLYGLAKFTSSDGSNYVEEARKIFEGDAGRGDQKWSFEMSGKKSTSMRITYFLHLGLLLVK